MAVWHVYAVALCLSMGQEIVPHRHNFATDSHQLLQESDDAELVSLATEAL
jgi:hypothetical protein